MSRYIKKLIEISAFTRGIASLMSGSIGGQLITMLSAPIITRLYSATDFGALAIFISFLGLAVLISSLRYELAIPLPSSKVEALNITFLSLVLVAFTSVSIGLLVVLYYIFFQASFSSNLLLDYIWLLPIGVLVAGSYTVLNYWSLRIKKFANIACSKIGEAISSNLIQVFGYKFGFMALIIGHLSGQVVGGSYLRISTFSADDFKHVSLNGIINVAKRYKRFPQYFVFGGLLNAAGQSLGPIIIASSFGYAAAGFYMLTNRVLSIPSSLIGTAVGQVFLSNAVEANKHRDLHISVEKIYTTLSYFGLPVAMIIVVVGPDMFSLVFGELWREAGEFARWMAPWIYIQFVTSPLSLVYTILEEQRRGLIFQLLLFILQAIALFTGILFNDLKNTIILVSGASIIGYSYMLFETSRLSNLPFKIIWNTLLKTFLTSIICLLPLIFAYQFTTIFSLFGFFSFIASIIFVILHYYFLMNKFSARS